MPAARRTEQLRSTLWKNLLIKRRAPRSTLCELVSPSLFILILVLGFYLSDIASYSAASYAVLTLDVGPLLELAIGFTSPVAFSAASLLGGGGGNSSGPSVNLIGLRDGLGPLLTGPLPVLDLPLFAGVSQAASAALSDENYRQLREFDQYGSLFGNILTLGTLHLAPVSVTAAAAVSAGATLAERLDEFQAFIARKGANVSVARHADEESALAFLGDASRRAANAWGLVVFADLSPRALNYSIRLNYTTVPNTNEITRTIARGLDTIYQGYTTSGFLTLQRLVDSFAFSLAADAGAVRVPPPAQETLLTPFPTAAYDQNTFYLAVQFLLALILTMCQLFPVALLVKSIVEEKELRFAPSLSTHRR